MANSSMQAFPFEITSILTWKRIENSRLAPQSESVDFCVACSSFAADASLMGFFRTASYSSQKTFLLHVLYFIVLYCLLLYCIALYSHGIRTFTCLKPRFWFFLVRCKFDSMLESIFCKERPALLRWATTLVRYCQTTARCSSLEGRHYRKAYCRPERW